MIEYIEPEIPPGNIFLEKGLAGNGNSVTLSPLTGTYMFTDYAHYLIKSRIAILDSNFLCNLFP